MKQPPRVSVWCMTALERWFHHGTKKQIPTFMIVVHQVMWVKQEQTTHLGMIDRTYLAWIWGWFIIIMPKLPLHLCCFAFAFTWSCWCSNRSNNSKHHIKHIRWHLLIFFLAKNAKTCSSLMNKPLDLPIRNSDFHSFVSHHQRVSWFVCTSPCELPEGPLSVAGKDQPIQTNPFLQKKWHGVVIRGLENIFESSRLAMINTCWAIGNHVSFVRAILTGGWNGTTTFSGAAAPLLTPCVEDVYYEPWCIEVMIAWVIYMDK